MHVGPARSSAEQAAIGGGRLDMVLSAYETSYHLALVVAFGIVLGGVAVVFWWPWLRHYRRSGGFARHWRDRIGPVGTVGGAG